MVKHVRYSPDLLRLRHGRGRRIGLYGGSFNPVHSAHFLCAERLAKAYKLDEIWWLIAPTNPLKINDLSIFSSRYLSLKNALESAHLSPRHRPSDLQHRLGIIYSIDLLRILTTIAAHHHFYWLAGTDILSEIHQWRDWQKLPQYAQFRFYNRKNTTMRGSMHPARFRMAKNIVRGTRSDLSSSQLRKAR